MIYAFYRFVSVIPTKSLFRFTNWQTKQKKARHHDEPFQPKKQKIITTNYTMKNY
jgi:hypothetical protein